MKKNGKCNGTPDKHLPAETPSETPVVRERPAYQRGLRIGNPGNKGGGATPNYVTEVAREHFLTRIPRLAKIADAELEIEETYTIGDLSGTIKRRPGFAHMINAIRALGENAGLKIEEHHHQHLHVTIEGGGLRRRKGQDNGRD